MVPRVGMHWSILKDSYGTEGRNRTGTPVKEPDFESGASTSSATPAQQDGQYSRDCWPWELVHKIVLIAGRTLRLIRGSSTRGDPD